MDISLSSLILLIITGFLAGLMDAAVGGGGLVQIPSLFGIMPANTPIPMILGNNKLASCLGTISAATQYARKIKLPWKMLIPAAILAFLGSYNGAKLAAYVPMNYMRPTMLVIMIIMFFYTFFRKNLGQTVRETELTSKEWILGLIFGGVIGFYDGIFGPGTGSLLAFVFVRFFAYDFLLATASAKIINLTTNAAALVFFIPNQYYILAWAIPLAIANLMGSVLGAHLAMRGGTKFLRYGFMVLLCVLIGKFAYDTVFK